MISGKYKRNRKEIHMDKVLNHLVNQFGEKEMKGLTDCVTYTTTKDALSNPIPMLQSKTQKQLNHPWRYTDRIVRNDKEISSDLRSNQKAIFTFNLGGDVSNATLTILSSESNPVNK